MKIRSIIIALGDTRIILQHDGYQIERLWHEHSNAEGLDGWIADAMSDADTLAVLRKAGVMVADLVHKLSDVANAEPVEPVAPIMQGFFWTRALDSSYRVHCATGHVLSWHATEAEAAAEVARRVAEAQPWTVEDVLRREG